MDVNFSRLLTQFAAMSPSILLYTAGIILAGAFWARNTKAALLVMLGCGLQLLVLVSFTVIYQVASSRIGSWGVNVEAIFFILSISHSLLSALAQGLILAAVFVGRKAPVPPMVYPPNKT